MPCLYPTAKNESVSVACNFAGCHILSVLTFEQSASSLIANGTVIPLCTSDVVDHESCMNWCAMNITTNSTIHCNGDSTYCSTIGTHVGGCVTTAPNCFCNTVYYLEHAPAIRDQDEVLTWVVGYNTTFLPDSHKRIEVVLDDPLIDVHYESKDKILKIHNDYSEEIIATLSKNTYVDVFKISGKKVLTINLHPALYHKSGDLKVVIYLDGSVREINLVWISQQKICRLNDCLLCPEVWEDFHCLPMRHQAGIISLLIVVVILSICCFPPVLVVFHFITGWIFCIFKKLIAIVLHSWRSPAAYKAYNFFGSIMNWMEKNLLRQSMRSKDTLLIIALFLPLALACEDSYILGGKLTECEDVDNGLAVSCQLEFQTQITFPPGTQTVCLHFNDTDNNILFSIQFDYLQFVESRDLRKIYATSEWRLKYDGQKRCYGSGHCKGHNCAHVKPDNTNPYSYISDHDVKSWPGETFCDRAPNTYDSGCFVSQIDYCIFSRYAIIPAGPIYLVSQPLSPYLYPVIRMTVKDGVSHINQTSTLTLFRPANFLNMFVEVIGSFASGATDLDKYKILQSGNNTYIGIANEPNQLAPGIGEIQSDSTALLSTATPNSFRFPISLVRKQVTSHGVKYTGKSFAYQPVLKKVPFAGSSYSTTLDNGRVLSEIFRKPAITLGIKTTTPITILTQVNRVCPEAKLIEISGCRNCEEGSVAKIEARSTCSTGSAVVSVQNNNDIDIKTKVIDLSTEWKQFSIHFSTVDNRNKFELIIKSKNREADLDIEFTAVDEKTINNDTYVHGEGHIRKDDKDYERKLGLFHHSLSAFFKDLVKGRLSWAEWLVTTILTFIIIILCVAIAYVSLPFAVKILPSLYKVIKYIRPKRSSNIPEVVMESRAQPITTLRPRSYMARVPYGRRAE
jgi:hypothetical protein